MANKKEINIEEIYDGEKSLNFAATLEDVDLEALDKDDDLYESLEDPVDGDVPAGEMSKLESEVEKLGDAEDMERMLEQEGLAIDDPVRMYLKEIGLVELLDPNTECELAKIMNNPAYTEEERDAAKEKLPGYKPLTIINSPTF